VKKFSPNKVDPERKLDEKDPVIDGKLTELRPQAEGTVQAEVPREIVVVKVSFASLIRADMATEVVALVFTLVVGVTFVICGL
jgi:hypothetical protein